MTDRRRLPTFLFIGPDKAGSSWLHAVLRQHPQVFVPACKDLYFYDQYYERGYEWYLRYFRGVTGQHRAVGEISHDYLYSSAAARRIYLDLPQAQLITCLRDPVERTFSQYLHLVRSGLTRIPFEDALVELPVLLDHSRYARHLERYLNLFEREQLAILSFERLAQTPAAVAREVFAFLGVDPQAPVRAEDRVRPASQPRSYWLARAASWAAGRARDLGLAGLVGAVKHNPLLGAFLYRAYGHDRPRLDESTRAWLKAELSADCRALREMVGEEFAPWIAAA